MLSDIIQSYMDKRKILKKEYEEWVKQNYKYLDNNVQ